MTEMNEFERGYVEAIFSSECDDGNPDLMDMTFTDCSDAMLATIHADCERFQADAWALLDELYGDYSEEQAGIEFWLTRNRHEAGFWDHGLSTGDELTELARSYGRSYLEVGDDGKLHLWPKTKTTKPPIYYEALRLQQILALRANEASLLHWKLTLALEKVWRDDDDDGVAELAAMTEQLGRKRP